MGAKSEQAPARRGGYRKRRRRSAEEIRGRLLSAAREEFGARSFSGATTAAIARRAGVAEVQMFRYFPSKAALFREAMFAPLIDHFRSFNAQHAAKAVDEDSAREHARLYIVELQAFLEEHARDLFSLAAAQRFEGKEVRAPGPGIADLQSYFSESVEQMSRRSRPASAIDPEKLVRVAFGTLLGCLTYRDWLFPCAPEEAGEFDEAVREFILQGVGPLTDPGARDG